MTSLRSLFSVVLVCFPMWGFAQISASFTVQHAGLAPSAEATVNVGDTIQFIYGSGGPHPMTSGHGTAIESPTFFPTVTVTAGAPEALVVLDEPGVYYFHCGTNPNNSSNWGTLNVVDPTSDFGDLQVTTWTPSWNASLRQLSFNGADLPTDVALLSVAGKLVDSWSLAGSNATVQVPELPAGLYIIRGNDGANATLWMQ